MPVPPPAGAERLADIQGLRAIAVLLVIGFHAGLPLPGGFTGVDVFFVISGFVIARLILREHASEAGFSLLRFYLRRFKRLTPALGITVAVVCLASAFLLSPLGPQQTVAVTGAGTMLLLANWAIVARSGDYFDDPASDNPLLNMWSLSVEEQFYLVFPVVLLIGLAIGRRIASPRTVGIVAVALLTAGSLAAAAAGYLGYGYLLGDAGWLLGFFSPVTRAWEFGVGVLLVMLRPRPPGRGAGLALASAGLALIAVGALAISDTTVFPGPMTLLPVLGAALVLHGNRGQAHAVSAALSTRPMVRIGDWSYSLYLWHWPLIVFALVLAPATWWAPLLAAALSFVPAIASFRYVEDPMRRWPLPLTRSRGVVLAGTWAGALAAAGLLYGAAQGGWLPTVAEPTVRVRTPGDLDGSSTWELIRERYNHSCGPLPVETVEDGPDVATCRQSQPDGPIDIALLGDSHAWQLYPALAEALPRANVAVLDTRGLPAPENTASLPAIEFLQESAPQLTIITSWWGKRGAPGDLFTTISALTVAGSDVIVLDDFPAFPFPPEGCVTQASPLAPVRCDLPRAAADVVRATYISGLEQAVEWAEGGELVSTYDYFCDQRLCSMTDGGELVYFNDNHLNLTGSRIAVDRLLREHPRIAAVASGL